MTKEESILISAYTGYYLTNDFSEVHALCEKALGRPIFSHEFASEELGAEIREKLLPMIRELRFDDEPARRGTWKHIKRHLWHRDEKGEIDMWYLDHGFHNGPGCEICGLSVCEHCEPDWAEQECKIGYYVCSSCGQPTKHGDTAYCPNCGARMDGIKTKEC